MSKILALDISTSCTGWSIFEGKLLLEAGAIETSSKKFPSLFLKMDFVVSKLKAICLNHKIDVVVAEAAFKKFAAGRSNASVIAMLIGFNFCLTYCLTKELGAKEAFLDVKTARKSVGLLMKKGADAKMIVHSYASKKYPTLNWEKKKTGRPKDWTIDMADALVIGESYSLK